MLAFVNDIGEVDLKPELILLWVHADVECRREDGAVHGAPQVSASVEEIRLLSLNKASQTPDQSTNIHQENAAHQVHIGSQEAGEQRQQRLFLEHWQNTRTQKNYTTDFCNNQSVKNVNLKQLLSVIWRLLREIL